MKKIAKKSISTLLISAITLSSVGLAGPVQVQGSEYFAQDIFISEYVEGSGYNKAIEIYNGTGETIDLSDYQLMKDKNGDDVFKQMYQFQGTLDHGQALVVSDKGAWDEILAVAVQGSLSFNGDDQVALYKSGGEIDRIGIPGDVNFAKDKTFVRNSAVRAGVVGPVDPRNSDEWTSYKKNTIEYLGSHTVSYGSSQVAAVTASQPSGEVAKGTAIELSTITEGATIYYAIEGEDVATTTGGVIGGYIAKEYTAPILINEDTTIITKATKDGLDESESMTYTYTIRKELEVSTIADAKAEYVDADKNYLDDGGKRKFRVVVTEADAFDYAFVSDDTGSMGLKLEEPVNLEIGDEVELVGTLGSSYDFAYLKVNYSSDVRVVGKKDVKATEVALADVGEEVEAALITLKNVTIKSGPKYGEYEVENGNSNFRIKPEDQSWIEVGKTYESITGVVLYSYRKFGLVARTELDIVVDSSKVREVKASRESGLVPKGAKITLSTLTDGAKIYYTLDGSEPTEASTLYTEPVAIEKDSTLKAIAVKENLNNSDVLVKEYTIKEVFVGKTIPEIQGESHVSPYNNKEVREVKGIVTSTINYKFDFMGGKRIVGFYMQDVAGDGKDSTSDAIFVRTNTTVAVGDEVSVNGLVKEYVKEMDFYAYDQKTQLATTSLKADAVTVLSSNNALPEAIVLGQNGRVVPHDQVSSKDFSEYDVKEYAIDFYESVESMMVKVEKPLAVSALKNRVLFVVPDKGAIAKKDGDLSSMGGVILQEKDVNTEILGLNAAIRSLNGVSQVETGATTEGDVQGILDYEWGTYQIYVTEELPTFTNIERQVDTLSYKVEGDELTIGSYNVYNHGGDDNAKSLDKARGIASTIVNGMQSPDIVGLVEVQDNDGKTNSDVVDASEVYQTFIDLIKEEGGTEYAWTDIPPVDDSEGGQPGGNIRVGFLYNPKRVSLRKGAKPGTSTETVDVDKDGHLTMNPGRLGATAKAFDDTRKPLAAEFVFKGQEVIVVANHLSSKGGDSPTYGNVQPAVKSSEVERVKQAQIVNDFVDLVLDKNPKSNVVLLGDFNDFQFSDAIRTITGTGKEQVLTNLIDTLPLEERYTYSFGGNSQVLDHIMVSNNLAKNAKVDVLNINSIISDKDKKRRHSDHDAVVASIQLQGNNKKLKPAFISKWLINDKVQDVETGVYKLKQGENINVKAGFKPYRYDVKEVTLVVKGVQYNEEGQEILYSYSMIRDLDIEYADGEVDLWINAQSMTPGKYTLIYELYDSTGKEDELSDATTFNVVVK